MLDEYFSIARGPISFLFLVVYFLRCLFSSSCTETPQEFEFESKRHSTLSFRRPQRIVCGSKHWLLATVATGRTVAIGPRHDTRSFPAGQPLSTTFKSDKYCLHAGEYAMLDIAKSPSTHCLLNLKWQVGLRSPYEEGIWGHPNP